MIVAITGTPGTGKTRVATALADLLSYEYVDVNAVAVEEGVETAQDPARDALAVEPDSLVGALADGMSEDAVLDGHLSHHYPADVTVVLRCRPDELRKRLQEKGWNTEKIRENVEAEVLDILLQQAVSMRDTVHEIDTTGKTPESVAESVKKIIDGDDDTHQPGRVQWDMETYLGDTR